MERAPGMTLPRGLMTIGMLNACITAREVTVVRQFHERESTISRRM
jgi:hypothetical protein